MSTTTTPARAEIIQIASALAQKFAARAAEHDADGSFPHENYADLRAVGYPLLTVPAAYGGWGAGLYDAVLAQEALAIGDGSTALAIGMHVQTVGAAASSKPWDNDLYAALCREIAERGVLINSCATEPELGSPSHGGKPSTTARLENGEWVINGRKSFASLSPELDYFIIPAAVRASDGTEQIVRFLVHRQPGITIDETWNAMGMRSTGSHDLYLSDVRVPETAVISAAPVHAPDPGKPMQNAWFVLTFCAVYLGIAAAAQHAALDYAHTRIPTGLGRPIATLESIQRRLGEAELALHTARAVLYRTAQRWDEQPDQRATMQAEIVACKLTVTNAALNAVDHAMRAVGGSSMTRSLPLERYYRDVRAGLYHPPSDDNGLALLGRMALDRAAKQA